MAQTFLTIQEAAMISGKSIQTIRRAIKSKKIKARKSKTPQGYNYMVDRQSLVSLYEIKNADEAKFNNRQSSAEKQSAEKNESTELRNEVSKAQKKASKSAASTEELNLFKETMQKLISQHEKDKENLFRLIKSFQDRMIVLENQVKMLESPKKRWYQFWK